MSQHESVLHYFLSLNNTRGMGRLLFFHLSMDGYLGCSHFLAITSNASMNKFLCRCTCLFLLGDTHTQVEFLCHTINACLNFWEISCFPNRLYLIVSSVCMEGSNFSTFLSTLVIVYFILALLVGVKWYLIVIMICIPDD